MSEHIQRIVFDLLQFRRSSYNATEEFSKLKHNADLCPRFQAKLEAIFDSFDKYRKITYDIQGPRDQGADVIARQYVDDQNQFICLQIKSEDDLRDEKYLTTLKAQFLDAQRAYRTLLDYYIIICTDLNDWVAKKKRDKRTRGGQERIAPAPLDKRKRNQVRVISGEFANVGAPVHVIEPEFALTFLRLTTVQIDAFRWQNFDGGALHVEHSSWRGQLQTPKTEASKKRIPLPPEIAGLLADRQGGAGEFIFSRSDGRSLDPDHLRRVVLYPALKAARIEVKCRRMAFMLSATQREVCCMS